ncbi:MAG: diacylglycerol kinase family lipid kinase [Myxococcales bacterium]|jgi:diacylglycerol kinase (ATP)|nr:diacylglycerol kinase family lipid kinase [Myxococcales bacterium]
MNERAALIINPAAAAGRAGRELPQVAAQVREVLGHDITVMKTERSGHATELARRAVLEGYTRVLSLGGDGTHGQVATGLMSVRHQGVPVLTTLPFGTGGDFSRLMNGPRTLRNALERMNGPVALIDGGECELVTVRGTTETVGFLNIASFGLAGMVDRLVNESRKRFGGKAAFASASVRAFLQYQPPRVTIRCDGNVMFDGWLSNVAVANGRFFGGGMMIAPEALVNDGMFDVTAIAHSSLVQSLPVLARTYGGTHIGHRLVSSARAAIVQVDVHERHAWADIDGEPLGEGPVTVRVLPQVLRVTGISPTYLSSGQPSPGTD